MPKDYSDSKNLSESVINNLSFTPTADQLTVSRHLGAFTLSTKVNPVYVLKGYAGTGKTSMLSAYVNTLKQEGIKFLLLAPTGRAAKVLAQYTGYQAHTIHRSIYQFLTNKDGITNIVLNHNNLRNSVFIIDEASMIGDNSQVNSSFFNRTSLLDDIIQFVFSQQGNKLILVGDTAQLPPVGTVLSPALDIGILNNSYTLTLFDFEMKEVMRQSLDSGILTSATILRTKIFDESSSPPFFKINHNSNDVTIIDDASVFEELLIDTFSGNSMEQGIIICRSNKQANMYNNQIRSRILMLETEVEAGDLLMVVKNNYYWLDKDSDAGFIANGDIIRITRFKKTEELYGFRFADVDIQLLDYPEEKELTVKILIDTLTTNAPGLLEKDSNRLFENIQQDYMDYSNRRTRLSKIKANPYFNALHVKFSYAMTCHKTQGGQWPNVFVDKGFVKDNKIDVEYLRWLYTATTRATHNLYLIGFNEEFFEEV
ncbi:MAG: AAA family ATPase [Bacteroidetes bacterium]|nr:AAA family ATPase [Bacteroidota bacterium]